jgi:opacity protein-like surface antigen
MVMVMAMAMLALIVSPARAQLAAGAIASGSVAAAVDGGTDASVAGSLGYRFNRMIGLGVEVTWMKLKAAAPSAVASPYTSIVYTDTKSDAIFFTTNVRIEIPTTSRRVLPYAVGGGGPASTSSSYTVTIRTVVPALLGPLPPGVVLPAPVPQIDVRPATTSSTGLGLMVGGGVALLATDHFSIDIDLRSLYIRGNPSGSIGRFGVGASYRF